MATAQTIIDRALRLIGAIASGESPTATEGADGLTALNAMLDSWRNEKLTTYAISDLSLTMTGAASYTVGPSGDVNTTRPLKVESAYQTLNGIDYPVEVIEKDEWDSIPDKTTTGDLVESVHYSPTVTTGTLYAYPRASGTLHINVRTPLDQFATVGTTVTLPPGYERALSFNLAIEIAPEYERQPSAAIIQMAKESKAAIKRTNSRPITGRSEFTTVKSSYNIQTGE